MDNGGKLVNSFNVTVSLGLGDTLRVRGEEEGQTEVLGVDSSRAGNKQVFHKPAEPGGVLLPGTLSFVLLIPCLLEVQLLSLLGFAR